MPDQAVGRTNGFDATAAAARRDAEALIEPAAQLVAESGLDRGQVRAVLPHVLVDVPVAILLVDQRSSEVVYANQAAVRMAGDISLPVPLAQWGTASSLTDLNGQPLTEADSALARVAAGTPVAGEPVRASGDGSSGLGRFLWATGIPLGAGDEEQPLALLVFLELSAPPGPVVDPELELAALRDRAIIATDLAFTISNPEEDDNPLLWVNPAFTRVTGYSLEEAVGRNCRFLQGPATDPDVVAELRDAVQSARPTIVTLLNYRKDGTAFWNQVSISPVFDGNGKLVSYVGIQADVSERVRVDAEREQALLAERAARQEIERARAQVALLAEVTTQLSATLDTTESLERLADLLVPALADWVVINLVNDGMGGATRLVLRHRNGHERLLTQYAAMQPQLLAGPSMVPRLMAGGDPILLSDVGPGDLEQYASPEVLEVVNQLGIASLMAVPLVARQRKVLGTMVLIAGPDGRRFNEEDLSVAVDMGRRAGISLDNARLYEQEHRVAEILQRSLLPAIPEVGGVTVSAQYLPANAVADVGGDFYEILALPDGSVGVAIGDVVGHDLAAAAAMGHLRGLLRACAWNHATEEAYADPERVLDRVDRLVQGLDVVPLATLVYARLIRCEGEWQLTWANAGHPAPVLRYPDGRVEVLRHAAGLLLGVAADTERQAASLRLPVGSTLVGYTDGLVERRGVDIDEGVERIAQIVADADPVDLDGLVRDVVAMLGADREDDMAVIAVRLDTA